LNVGKTKKVNSSLPFFGEKREAATLKHERAEVGTPAMQKTNGKQDLQERLAMHNTGHVPHTSEFAPWYIETAIAFRDKEKAFAYERYLKTGAGRAYAIKHF